MSDDSRLGGSLARHPLHFVWLLDVSGSMAADGKIQALNVAVREAIPHLQDAAATNPGAELLVQALAFAHTARWVVAKPTPIAAFSWSDVEVEPKGTTELGVALRELAGTMRAIAADNRGFAPAVVLVSDGQPTDLGDPSFRDGLSELRAEPWGDKAVRLAVGIGRDVDLGVLKDFIGHPELEPLRADNPEQLAAAVRFVSTAAVRASSNPLDDYKLKLALPTELPAEVSGSTMVW